MCLCEQDYILKMHILEMSNVEFSCHNRKICILWLLFSLQNKYVDLSDWPGNELNKNYNEGPIQNYP